MEFALLLKKINKKGVPKLRKIFRGGSGNRWDQGERNVLEGLKEFNLVDAYRQLHPIPKKAYSFVIERKGRVVAKRRFDHFFLSKEFKNKIHRIPSSISREWIK